MLQSSRLKLLFFNALMMPYAMRGVTLLRGFSHIAAGSGPYYPRKVRDHCSLTCLIQSLWLKEVDGDQNATFQNLRAWEGKL